MRLVKSVLVILVAVATFSPAQAWDIKGAINKIANASGKTAEENTNDAASTDSKSAAGGIGNLIQGVASAFGVGGEFKFDDLVGEWKYAAPAVQFKSDNLLMQAGGVAAASTVEEKLEPYYKMAGCDNMTLSIAADSTFTMNLKLGKVNGTISQSEDGKQIFFNFAMFKKVKLGTMEAFVTKKSADDMELTFDVSGMLELLEKIGSMTSKSSVSTVTELLKQYDGLTAGFELKKS